MNKLVSQGTRVMETDYSCVSIETPSQGIEHPIALYVKLLKGYSLRDVYRESCHP